jgi:threonine dehydrogenase-like Zn-dependent dehydrogenase
MFPIKLHGHLIEVYVDGIIVVMNSKKLCRDFDNCRNDIYNYCTKRRNTSSTAMNAVQIGEPILEKQAETSEVKSLMSTAMKFLNSCQNGKNS